MCRGAVSGDDEDEEEEEEAETQKHLCATAQRRRHAKGSEVVESGRGAEGTRTSGRAVGRAGERGGAEITLSTVCVRDAIIRGPAGWLAEWRESMLASPSSRRELCAFAEPRARHGCRWLAAACGGEDLRQAQGAPAPAAGTRWIASKAALVVVAAAATFAFAMASRTHGDAAAMAREQRKT